MTPSIEIDDEVFELLKEHAEPLVDSPNSVLRRLLSLELSEGELGSEQGDANKRAEELAPQRRRPKRRAAKSKRKRAPRGSLLPETEYELPILRVLAGQPNGRAAAREVIEMIEPHIAPHLTDLDKERIDSGLLRWHNRAQFARLHLVRAGELSDQSPRGVWEITPAGQERVKKAEGE